MQLDEPVSEVQKIDAARRQLDEAIRLWMEGRDPLAIHTLTMAAFGVLYDVAEHRGLLQEDDPVVLHPSERRQFRKLANFLKHADKDPLSSCIEPPVVEHEGRIGLALLLYRLLVNDLTPEMGAFHLTMLMTYTERFQVAPDPDPHRRGGTVYRRADAQELGRSSADGEGVPGEHQERAYAGQRERNEAPLRTRSHP